MIDQVVIGASVSLTPAEADKLAGDGPVRLVTCKDGRVVGGVGSVGLVEHLGDTDLSAFIAAVTQKRADLGVLAEQPGKTLYTFTRI